MRTRGARMAIGVALLAFSACVSTAVDPETARLEAACEEHPPSCLEASRRYAADGSAQARQRRFDVLRRACAQGVGAACDELAAALRRGEVPIPARSPCGGVEDAKSCAAQRVHHEACEGGRGSSCAAAAALARASPGGEEEAAVYAARGCEAGHAPSCRRLGEAQRPSAPDRGLASFRRGCELDHGPACLELARNQAHGWGHPVDLELARRSWSRGCELRSAEACFRGARAHELGIGGGTNLYEARTTYRKACSLGSATACEAFARMVEAGRGGDRQPPLAYDYFRKAVQGWRSACEAGEAEACVDWSRLLMEGSGTTQDRPRAADLQQEACRAGVASGCVALVRQPRGLAFEKVPEGAQGALVERCADGEGDACVFAAALGVRVDLAASCAEGHGRSCTAEALRRPLRDDRSRRLLRRACALGDPGGCHHLGLALELPGVDQDLEAAVRAHRRGCRWGDGAACRGVGTLLLRGEGLRLEPLEAASAFEAGCEHRDAASCHEIGTLRLEGQRVARNPRFAIRFLERGCRLGSAAACGRLGFALLRGKWVKRDAFRARELLRRACDASHPRSCLDLAEAEERGTLLPKDEAAAARHRVLAAAASQARCEARILACGEEDTVRATTWIASSGTVRRQVAEVLPCGAELERTCDDAVQAWTERCDRDEAACWPAAHFVRVVAGEGMAASEVVAEAQERRAVAWARQACRKDDAAACAVLAEAYDEGRGGLRAEPRQARRFRERTCELDPARCSGGG